MAKKRSAKPKGGGAKQARWGDANDRLKLVLRICLEYRKIGAWTQAIEKINGPCARTVFRWRHEDEAIRDAMADAEIAINDRLIETMVEMAIEEKNVTLLIFLAKSRMPHKFSERVQSSRIEAEAKVKAAEELAAPRVAGYGSRQEAIKAMLKSMHDRAKALNIELEESST